MGWLDLFLKILRFSNYREAFRLRINAGCATYAGAAEIGIGGSEEAAVAGRHTGGPVLEVVLGGLDPALRALRDERPGADGAGVIAAFALVVGLVAEHELRAGRLTLVRVLEEETLKAVDTVRACRIAGIAVGLALEAGLRRRIRPEPSIAGFRADRPVLEEVRASTDGAGCAGGGGALRAARVAGRAGTQGGIIEISSCGGLAVCHAGLIIIF